MLVVTLRVNQSLKIGDDVTVKVVGRRGDYIEIGIDAPRSIPVVRTSIAEKAPD